MKARLARFWLPEGTENVKVNAPIAVLLEEGESADDIDAQGRCNPAQKAATKRGRLQ